MSRSSKNHLDGPEPQEAERSPISQYLAEIGRRGGLKGGLARKAALSKKRRKEIAQNAAKARWEKEK